MEQIVASVDGVAECAVIGADDAIKGMVPIAFVVPRAGFDADDTLERRVIAAVRAELGAVAALKTAYIAAGSTQRALARSCARSSTANN